MISTLKAKLIAKNPDACHTDDLVDLIEFCVDYPASDIDPQISLYCCYSFIVRTLRSQGKIDKAVSVEILLERIYRNLPKEMRW